MPTDDSAPAITYVVSQYPAISHTFILGEVNGIKAQGINVKVASINTPDRPFEQLTDDEQIAYDDTLFVKQALFKKLPYYLLLTLFTYPRGFFGSLWDTLKNCLHNPASTVQKIAYWLEAMVVADLAKRQGSQHLHAHFSTQGCTVAMLAAQIMGIDFSFTVHGPDEFYHVGEQQLEKKFAAAKFIICISDFAKSQVMKYTAFTEWDKLHINYLGVDTTQFSPALQVHNNEIPVLLCVGRLVNAKGQGVLLQAAKILIDRGVNFTLQIVGDGPDKIDLEKFSATHQLTQHVNFMGKVNHDQIQKLQQKADIFVLPSFAEGIPIVLMEAMACGTPCVTTHITGIPELFTHDHDGLLVRPGNAIMLADALEQLITQDDTRDRLKTAALATVRDKWCIHQSNQRLAKLFIQRLS
ncbi:glycosyl transferase, group 1 family protein [gamma proteobacterium IMCC1989]|nr:glycosyl transferase, group 1 family protein [gamma proteobacterium IMCC1989]